MLDRFERFSFAIAEISRCWRKLASDELAKYGLKSPHATYLTTMYKYPDGPTCHTGTGTCWGEHNAPHPLMFLSELSDFIEKRHREMPEGSYTTSLFRDGLNRMAQKVGEEALELVIEATNGSNDRLIYEGSDMLYHLIVLLTSKGLRIEDMAAELMERHNPNWKKH